MVEVVGVRFRTAGKIYFFDPKEFQVRSGDQRRRRKSREEQGERKRSISDLFREDQRT